MGLNYSYTLRIMYIYILYYVFVILINSPPIISYRVSYKVVPPPVISWLIIPIDYRYYPLINPSYSTYKPTEC